MSLPSVAIIGRPNVGKSSLFNALAGRRMSIVDPMAGVTRDRVTAVCDIDGSYFELVDTGGHGIVDRDDLSEHIETQIRHAMDRAGLILFVVDARDGLTALDADTAELLRNRHVVERTRLIANKVDDPAWESRLGEFSRLGVGDALAVSALHGYGRAALRELIHRALSEYPETIPDDPVMKVAIVGKRNAGKSSFLNALVGEERVIVSEVPGTTRDSIDVRFEKDGRTIVAIDTAGVRKRSKLIDSVEFYAFSRAQGSIRRADVVLLLMDATTPVAQADKMLAHFIAGEYKPCVLVVNKWDLAKGQAASSDYGGYLTAVLPELRYAPVAFTSANTGRNTLSTIDLATTLLKQARTRVGTGRLNNALQKALAASAPKSRRRGKTAKFFYATQVSTEPPTIVLFVNHPELVDQQYERFLVNRFRETLPYPEIPIRLVFRARGERVSVA